jgi:hypothetical protein
MSAAQQQQQEEQGRLFEALLQQVLGQVQGLLTIRPNPLAPRD